MWLFASFIVWAAFIMHVDQEYIYLSVALRDVVYFWQLYMYLEYFEIYKPLKKCKAFWIRCLEFLNVVFTEITT